MMDAAWGLVAATIVLGIATFVLCGFTYQLYRATVRLASLEAHRNREEARQLQLNKVVRKQELAEEVRAMQPKEEVLDILAQGSLPERPARTLRTLHRYLDYDSDQVLREDMDRLLLALDSAEGGGKPDKDNLKELEGVFKRIQERLFWDRVKWRYEVECLSRIPGY